MQGVGCMSDSNRLCKQGLHDIQALASVVALSKLRGPSFSSPLHRTLQRLYISVTNHNLTVFISLTMFADLYDCNPALRSCRLHKGYLLTLDLAIQ